MNLNNENATNFIIPQLDSIPTLDLASNIEEEHHGFNIPPLSQYVFPTETQLNRGAFTLPETPFQTTQNNTQLRENFNLPDMTLNTLASEDQFAHEAFTMPEMAESRFSQNYGRTREAFTMPDLLYNPLPPTYEAFDMPDSVHTPFASKAHLTREAFILPDPAVATGSSKGQSAVVQEQQSEKEKSRDTFVIPALSTALGPQESRPKLQSVPSLMRIQPTLGGNQGRFEQNQDSLGPKESCKSGQQLPQTEFQRRLGATVPATVRTQGAKITYEDFMSILEMNGHDTMISEQHIDILEDEESLPVIEDDYHRKVMNDAVQAERDAGMTWSHLKSSPLFVEGGDEYRNPYSWRGWFTRGDTKDWVEPLRKSVIEAGGWDYECLINWEKEGCEVAPEKIQDWIFSRTPQDLDSTQRGWLFLQLKDCLTRAKDRDEMAVKYSQMFWPENWTQATPYNCFWLRFPDCSPLMPWRQYKTMKMVVEWYKMNKRKIASIKNKLISMMNSATPAARFLKKADRYDNEIIEKILKGPKRPLGFRTYTSTPEFKARMAIEVAKRMEAIRQEKQDPKYSFCTQEQFRLREAFKREAWNELDVTEKKIWEEVAANSKGKDIECMTADEITLAFHRHMVSHFHQVANRANIYMVIYAAMSYEDKEWVTFTEAGQSPIGTSITTGPWRKEHEGMIQATMDAASRRGNVEREKIEYAEFIGSESVAWAEEPEPELGSGGTIEEPGAILLPELPFTAAAKPDKNLSKRIHGWIKGCLMRVHGIDIWKINDWKRFRDQPDRFFENLPQDGKGGTLAFRNFEVLDRRELEIWRDHLLASFSSPPRTERPFSFKLPTGNLPKLTKLQQGPLTPADPPTRRRRARRQTKGQTSKGKAKEQEDDEEILLSSNESTAASSSTDSETVPTTSAPRVHPRRRAAKVAEDRISKAFDHEHDRSTSSETQPKHASPLPAAKRRLPGSEEQLKKRISDTKLSIVREETEMTQTPAAVISQPFKPTSERSTLDSRSFTFQTASMGGLHGTLPPDWAVFGYNQSQVDKDLMLITNPLYFNMNDGFIKLLQELPPVFMGIRHRRSSVTLSHPWNPLDIASSLYLLKHTLADYRTSFSGELAAAPGLDDKVNGDRKLKTTLAQIMHITGPLPDNQVLNNDFGSKGQPEFTQLLLTWVRNSLLAWQVPKAISTADIPDPLPFQILRCLFYCSSASDNPISFLPTFTSAINVLGAVAISRYSKLVLQKVITTIVQELSAASCNRRTLAIELAQLISTWCNYCEIYLPHAFADDEYLLCSDQFPSLAMLPKNRGDALLSVLEKAPWWSSDSSNFPLLVECPRTFLLEEVINEVELEVVWDFWLFLDKFAMFISIIAASIPYLNDWLGTRTPGSSWKAMGLSENRISTHLLPNIAGMITHLSEEIALYTKKEFPQVPKPEEYQIQNLRQADLMPTDVPEKDVREENAGNQKAGPDVEIESGQAVKANRDQDQSQLILHSPTSHGAASQDKLHEEATLPDSQLVENNQDNPQSQLMLDVQPSHGAASQDKSHKEATLPDSQMVEKNQDTPQSHLALDVQPSHGTAGQENSQEETVVPDSNPHSEKMETEVNEQQGGGTQDYGASKHDNSHAELEDGAHQLQQLLRTGDIQVSQAQPTFLSSKPSSSGSAKKRKRSTSTQLSERELRPKKQINWKEFNDTGVLREKKAK